MQSPPAAGASAGQAASGLPHGAAAQPTRSPIQSERTPSN